MAQLSVNESPEGIKQPLNLLGLPFEVRTRIYAYAMRADCGLQGPDTKCTKDHHHPDDFSNSMSLLYTCKQIYLEVFEIVRRNEVTLVMDGSSPSSYLRDPREFGKPSYFLVGQHFAAKRNRPVPVLFEPLQIASLREVHLKIALPLEGINVAVREGDSYGRELYYSNIAQHVREVASALGKSWMIEKVRLSLVGIPDVHDEEEVRELYQTNLQKILKPILTAASRAGFKLLLDEYSEIIKFLAIWLFDAAREAKISVETSPRVKQFVARSEDDPDLIDSGPNMLEEDLKPPRDPRSSKAFRLQVECRCCYQLFRRKAELTKHLKKHPSHKQVFKIKQWSKLSIKAVRQPTYGFKCLTCAMPCATRRKLDDHVGRAGHCRPGVVSRYEEDKWRMNDIYALGPRRAD